jgi:S1-C subfamily serine protease
MQEALRSVAKQADPATLAIFGWSDPPGPSSRVLGTAFLVSEHGHFLTAAHVVRNVPRDIARLTVVVRQRDNLGSMGAAFEIIEADEGHDLALCKIQNFESMWKTSTTPQPKGTFQGWHLGTVKLAPSIPPRGTFVAVIGFPLGSWSSTVQFGTLAATETISPSVQGVPAGNRSLLQIDTAANKGNSGSPVIELDSGNVIGIIIQALPAPLYSTVEGLPFGQSSGIAIAAPSTWATELLKRNGIQ